MPQPILTSHHKLMDDNGKYVRKERQQSDQPCFACEPSKSDESKFDHICPNNPILTCNCADPKFCAELGNDPDRQYRDSADTNQDGFADNIDYTGIPIPAPKGKTQSVVGLVLSLELFVKPGLQQPNVFFEPQLVSGIPNNILMQDLIMMDLLQQTGFNQPDYNQDLGFEQ
jgi:hypothetical protein